MTWFSRLSASWHSVHKCFPQRGDISRISNFAPGLPHAKQLTSRWSATRLRAACEVFERAIFLDCSRVAQLVVMHNMSPRRRLNHLAGFMGFFPSHFRPVAHKAKNVRPSLVSASVAHGLNLSGWPQFSAIFAHARLIFACGFVFDNNRHNSVVELIATLSTVGCGFGRAGSGWRYLTTDVRQIEKAERSLARKKFQWPHIRQHEAPFSNKPRAYAYRHAINDPTDSDNSAALDRLDRHRIRAYALRADAILERDGITPLILSHSHGCMDQEFATEMSPP